jgi:hypothetical protein
MKKILCAGVCALAITAFMSTLPAKASDFSGYAERAAAIDVGRIKSVLRLTAQQEPYWPPVEAALRNLARQQAPAEQAGLVKRISRRMVSVVLDSAAIQRLAVAARPLISRLDSQQMQAASGLIHEMGLGPVVAALR